MSRQLVDDASVISIDSERYKVVRPKNARRGRCGLIFLVFFSFLCFLALLILILASYGYIFEAVNYRGAEELVEPVRVNDEPENADINDHQPKDDERIDIDEEYGLDNIRNKRKRKEIEAKIRKLIEESDKNKRELNNEKRQDNRKPKKVDKYIDAEQYEELDEYKVNISKPVPTEDREYIERAYDNYIMNASSGGTPIKEKEALDAFVDLLAAEAVKRKIQVIEGRTERCLLYGLDSNCVDRKTGEVMGVLKWELRTLAVMNLHHKFEKDARSLFDTFLKFKVFNHASKQSHSKYTTFGKRFYYFRHNSLMIEKHNQNPKRRYNMGYTIYTDRSDEEAVSALLSNRDKDFSYLNRNKEYLTSNVPIVSDKPGNNLRAKFPAIDWRKKNAIGPVINQGPCGSCWAVSTREIVSAHLAIKSGSFVNYSVQQLLDCTSPDYDCKRGGSHFTALKYAVRTGMCTEDEYKYVGYKGKCKNITCGQDQTFGEIVKLEADEIEQHLLDHGPVMIYMKLSRDFLHYMDGVFDGSCANGTAHSVVIVGVDYDRATDSKHWLIKNSWGTKFGEDGYFRMLVEPVTKSKPLGFCNIGYYAFGIRL